jgi:hypothetical protein
MPPLRRRPRRRRHVYAAPSRQVWSLALWLCLVLAAIAGLYRFTTTARYAVTLNGATLVVLESRETAEGAILATKRHFAAAAPEAVHFSEGELAVRTVHSLPMFLSTDDAAKRIAPHLTATVAGYAIIVNRKPLVLLGSRDAAEQAISQMLLRYAKGRHGYPTFKDRVVIRAYEQATKGADLIPVMSATQAAQELTHPPRPQYCTVARGDSFYRIAMSHGTTVDEIKRLNPDTNPGALHIGDQVRLPDLLAPITIVMKESP